MSLFDTLSVAIRAHEPDSARALLTEATARNLSVYSSAYLATLRESLARTYPVTQRLLGENNFRYFARGYGEHHPPSSPSIDHFGAGFPEYLACEPELKRTQPTLAYFAKLDWFHHHPLAPEILELALPAGLTTAYDELRRSDSMGRTQFGPCSRHRLVRTAEPG